jgi:hypothetical protein
VSRLPGSLLLHPVAVAAVALMAFNDHWLKAHHPGWVSGKLSDVAGLVVLPLTMCALAEIAAGRPLGARWRAGCIAVSALGYSLVEVWPLAEAAWCWTWGALQWPFRAAWAWAAGQGIPAVARVVATSDWTDLLVLPASAFAWLPPRAPPERAE